MFENTVDAESVASTFSLIIFIKALINYVVPVLSLIFLMIISNRLKYINKNLYNLGNIVEEEKQKKSN